MQDISISKFSRKCAESGAYLRPGEAYYSVIAADSAIMTRIDVSASQWPTSRWSQANANVIGWWRSRMPEEARTKPGPAPSGVLLDSLAELLARPGQEALAYLLALLLVRRQVLQEMPSPLSADAPSVEPESHVWNLVCPTDNREWCIPVVSPPPETIEALQAQLKQLLFID